MLLLRHVIRPLSDAHIRFDAAFISELYKHICKLTYHGAAPIFLHRSVNLFMHSETYLQAFQSPRRITTDFEAGL